MPDNRLNWLRLASMSNWVGATLMAGLIKKYQNPALALKATSSELMTIQGWDSRRAKKFVAEAPKSKPICSLEELENKNIRLITFTDSEYPSILREIPDSPLLLYAKGQELGECSPAIAVVGARNASQMGYEVAHDFAYKLAKAGFTIISGLALGIDTYAHRGALEAGGKTIAVLANGVDITYPRSNAKTREKILKTGAVVSEYAPGVAPLPWYFPIRNRIISGMCIATLVIEASARSGSLITARLAGEQNREIFAVPGGSGKSPSQGTMDLIKEGANLVTSPEEIIDYYQNLLPEENLKNYENLKKEEEENDNNLNAEERKLLIRLAEEADVDSLLSEGWNNDKLFSLLLQLEMRNYIVRLSGGRYQTRREIKIR
ncbi:MAG: DNA-processing protein DprA [Candidatus Riflebacteria bacterium]|nr:DNA-processing protein DprA [Candidatus Riflebacteria bacterium]